MGWLYLAEESSHAVLWAFFGGTAWVMWSLPVDADAFFLCSLTGQRGDHHVRAAAALR